MSRSQRSLVTGEFLSESNPRADILIQWVLFVLGALALMPIWSEALPEFDPIVFGVDMPTLAVVVAGLVMAVLVHEVKTSLDAE